MVTTIADRVEAVQATIASAAAKAGRSAESVTLIAVSKTHPASVIEAAYGAGVRHFGENRTDELAEKVATLSHLNRLRWHFIGTLQSRQTKAVAQYADVFHALDRLKIGRRLAGQVEEFGRILPVFIEVNVSGEGSKSGFNCDNWENDGAQRDVLQQAAATIAALPRIEIQGLMTMAPWGAPERDARTVFARTRRLAEWLTTAVPSANWSHLSMGMTDDYMIAIEEGATHVRVGRALFGARTY
jgi:pyridoxal phosphate enzyme (YggS family)